MNHTTKRHGSNSINGTKLVQQKLNPMKMFAGLYLFVRFFLVRRTISIGPCNIMIQAQSIVVFTAYKQGRRVFSEDVLI